MTIDWIDLIAEIKSHHCPPTTSKDCLDDELHCSVCWGKHIEKLVLDDNQDPTGVDTDWKKYSPIKYDPDLSKIEQFNRRINSKKGRYS